MDKDGLNSSNLLKRQVSDFQIDLISQLGRSQTPLQGALNSPILPHPGSSSETTIPPPGLFPINNEANNTNNNNTNENEIEKSEEELTSMDRYGLNGLLPLIRMENNDQTTVAIGTDLNLLGLNMSEDFVNVKLSKTFASPWVETSRSEVEPTFNRKTFNKIEIDDSINAFQEKLSLFTDETLFFIFYTKTRDILQEFSSRELMSRNWRYHKELQVWLTKDSSVEPIQISNNSEKGLYIFFDPHSWEKIKKEFILNYQSIMS